MLYLFLCIETDIIYEYKQLPVIIKIMLYTNVREAIKKDYTFSFQLEIRIATNIYI